MNQLTKLTEQQNKQFNHLIQDGRSKISLCMFYSGNLCGGWRYDLFAFGFRFSNMIEITCPRCIDLHNEVNVVGLPSSLPTSIPIPARTIINPTMVTECF